MMSTKTNETKFYRNTHSKVALLSSWVLQKEGWSVSVLHFFLLNLFMFICCQDLCCGQKALGENLGFNASKWNHGGWSWSSIWFVRNVEPSNPAVFWKGLVAECLPICSQSKLNQWISVPSNKQWSIRFEENQRYVICTIECHLFYSPQLFWPARLSMEGSQQARQENQCNWTLVPTSLLGPLSILQGIHAALFFQAKDMLSCSVCTMTTSKWWTYTLLCAHNLMN